MTREELIRNLRYTMKKHENDKLDTFGTDIHQLCKDVLSVLEQDSQQALSAEPCEDAISREEALECFPMIMQGMGEYTALAIRNKLRKLPSVKVEPQEWISVKDRLPDEHEEVLACDIDGDIHMGWMHDRTHLSAIDDYYKNIVAWKPLPNPYKGEE